MQLDERRVEEAASWFRKAEDDLRAARVDLDAVPPLIGDALFHCQQASEKVLKAFLAWHDARFRKTHDLGELGKQSVEVDPSLESICRRAEPLTVFATVFRYPGEPGKPSMGEAERALETAHALYVAVVERLPPAVTAS